MFPRYSIRSLLIAAPLLGFAIFVWMRMRLYGDAREIIALGALCMMSGYLVGRYSQWRVQGRFELLLCSCIIGLNWLLWYFNHIAFILVRRTDRPLPSLLAALAHADELGCYNLMAALVTIAVAYAVLKRKHEVLFGLGAACVLIWLVLMTIGFLTASSSLLDIIHLREVVARGLRRKRKLAADASISC